MDFVSVPQLRIESVQAQLAVAAMRRRAKETAADQFTLDDVNAEIKAARRQRKR